MSQSRSQGLCLDSTEIQAILPHRYPFLLVDRIEELEIGKRVIGIKNVTVNEPFFQGHFPGRPIMPGVLIIEAMAQVGGVLAFKSANQGRAKLVYFMGIDKAKFRKPVVPGDRLRFVVDVLRARHPYWKMRGEAYVEDSLVCEAELMAMVTDGTAAPEDEP
ncbi:MAG TPA: 3-hydroxyacyl-ACP dehydratase FabZ [Nitrospirales bacterium]|nr:3-hydroxyacyl-ACP dehydratase FabZ [Nitrospirales bacterium]